MALKTKYSQIFVKISNALKIDIQALIDPLNRPVSFSVIGQVVFEQQSFKVLKSIRSIGNLQFQ